MGAGSVPYDTFDDFIVRKWAQVASQKFGTARYGYLIPPVIVDTPGLGTIRGSHGLKLRYAKTSVPPCFRSLSPFRALGAVSTMTGRIKYP